jgi:cell wall assembly regulator SMI1
MKKKHPRVIGTTEDAIERAEKELQRVFPPSFRAWLLENNGLWGLEGIHIFPVQDDRDIRKTWNSIVRENRENWTAWLDNFENYEYSEDEQKPSFEHLLPFANYGTGDFYCFDYSQPTTDGEYAIVWWSHETGETEFRAITFSEFVQKEKDGEFEYD